MARDYENIEDRDDLSDAELRDVVRERLSEHQMLDLNDIEVTVREGVVTLGGRVGTESEMRIAEHVVTDTLGLTDVENEIVVDAVRRAESPAAIDDHLVEEDEQSGLLLGDRPLPFNPEAEHLEPDVDAEVFGTTDVQRSIERGTGWVPPTSPTPEGLSGTDASPGAYGEDH